MNSDNKWVDARMAVLNSAAPDNNNGNDNDWQPDANRARARIRTLNRRSKIRRGFAWIAPAAACLGLLAFLQPSACAFPRRCVESSPAPAAAQPAPAPQTPATPPRPYKESGSPNAPIVCEIYSDYQCPECGRLFHDVVPPMVAEYVQTGKVKLVHKDFPLPQHQYAKLAARYANAAGQAGVYELAVTRIFETQNTWRVTGDIESQLAAVLSPDVMSKVRAFVEHDAKLGADVDAATVAGYNEGIRHTPTVMLVFRGKREEVGTANYGVLKARIDQLLQQLAGANERR